MALSEVGICNLALGWLGANLITSIDDDTVEGRLCDANYESSRDAALEDRDWTFATSRRSLTLLGTAPAFGYSKAFQLPAECLRVIRACSDVDFLDDTDWVREGNTLLANVDTLYAKYIKRITDTNLFSPLFVQAVAARLATDIAIPITGSRDMQDLMYALYERKISVAGTMDGMQGKNAVLRSNTLIDVRAGRGEPKYKGAY